MEQLDFAFAGVQSGFIAGLATGVGLTIFVAVWVLTLSAVLQGARKEKGEKKIATYKDLYKDTKHEVHSDL